MCGIAGAVTATPADVAEGVAATTARLAHRGPDGADLWHEGRVALGHRRLAVVGLGPDGAQPMASASGRYVIVYNGELYGSDDLRRALEGAGARFRGTSDTEVLLAAVERWGVEGALDSVLGMFAFGLWDRTEQRLWLARDRLGEKPLVYARVGDGFVFASEVRALSSYPGFDRALDPAAVALLLRHGCVPAPFTVHASARKLPPGTWISVDARGAVTGPCPYWSAADVARQGASAPLPGLDVDALDTLLARAVDRATVSEVPLGAFLSGGIDSSLVVALLRRGDRPVRTFTVGFDDPAYDESPYAERVAAHLGTDHTTFRLDEAQALEAASRMTAVYDEPFADSSQIPTWLLAREARRHVTVALTGDGGDEVFGGYRRHVLEATLFARSDRVPRGVRAGAARALLASSHLSRGTDLARGARLLADGGAEARYARFVALDDEGSVAQEAAPTAWTLPGGVPTAAERVMLADTVGYLPDDVLVKVDRATMAVGLESRAPFLGHDVVAHAWRLPLGAKVRGRRGKVALRRLLERYVPPALVERPKRGFAVPLGTWLRGPLRDWAGTLLERRRLAAAPLLDVDLVRARWEEHLLGRRDRSKGLWSVLMLQAWLEREGLDTA